MEHLQTKSSTTILRPIRCIIKLGGAAITCKNDFETINEENLNIVASQIREAIVLESVSSKVIGMDWSKRPGMSQTPTVDISDQDVIDSQNFIVVHGAGSFGHFQASKSGVHKGGLSRTLVKSGFVATRISVTSLNLDIIAAADVSMVAKAIDSGFVPVLHGDAVLDTAQECTILSGDLIISHLAADLRPDFVVFLTDVYGVYDRPPTEPNATLLREIAVHEDGSWSVIKPILQGSNKVEMTAAAHDTTGGMETKIAEAAMIAKLGIDVYIVKAATEHSLKALCGSLKDEIPEDWLGTVIRLAR